MEKPDVKNDVVKREEEILAFWNKNEIFKKTLEKDAPKGEFVFYDGPPFATGTPHYGHLLQSTIKDTIPRYKTMRGYRVERQWGWDCHGLPIENIVEKELKTKSKKDIVAMGVKKFNDECRKQIFTFTHEWERIVPRLGRWADMEHPYRTMDFGYMQSEWWAFKQLYEKGLIYEDYRSMHICPRCETTLSQGEVAEGYKDVKDLSVTVKFRVKNPEKHGLPENTYLLAWTTTPWTLPGNVALAVSAKESYAIARLSDSETYIFAFECGPSIPVISEFMHESRFCRGTPESDTYDLVLGDTLKGIEYEPLFDYYEKNEELKNHKNGWKVYTADFVTTDTGTGIVHIAPAFGADDMKLGKEKNLPFVQHVKMDGTFKSEVSDFPNADLKPRAKDRADEVREIDLEVWDFLNKQGKVFDPKKVKYDHSYPHCWRCETALLNYATSSWFVAVEKVKPTLLETAKGIHWSPEHIKEGRFGQWLEGARDWSISRQRFWANTIPVWRCEKCKAEKVFGSAAELEKASGKKVEDLHKDVVDEVTFMCECGGDMRRVPDVLDTWFDSGSAPYATAQYPQGTEKFKKRFPADFIAEAQDQTRAWFYYMHVLAGALFESAAFKHCVVTGIVLAEDGKKMSKKLQNYPDTSLMLDKYGADAMRLYMLTSPVVQADNLAFSEKGVDEVVKKNIGRLHNVLAFYQLYADGTVRDWKSEHVLDRWILSRLEELVEESTVGYEAYQLDSATRPIAAFIDDLSTWYLRRSRDRFKTEGADKAAALATMRYVLHRLSRVLAPSMPFYAEYLFQAVREEEDEESVHLATWPGVEKEAPFDVALVADMEKVRGIVTLALQQRDSAGIKIRQPLSELSLSAMEKIGEEFLRLIQEEVNVKSVTQKESGELSVQLNTDITPELKEEGLVRDIIRALQDARKQAGLKPGDVAAAVVTGNADVGVALRNRRAAILAATTLSLVSFETGGILSAKVAT